ncbi:MAG: DUF456 family protein [Syntrophales bacterium]|nr:DUF456 family protein [Syntrophales bacterium]
MTSLEMVLAGIFIIALFGCLFLTIFGLPGVAIIFLIVLVYALFTEFAVLGVHTLILLFVLAVVAEIIDFSVGVTTSFYLGLSIHNFLAALIGSILGMTLFTPFLMGLGTLLGFFLGGFGGVAAAELIRQIKLKPAFRASSLSIFKRLGSTAIKGLIGVYMISITLIHVYS